MASTLARYFGKYNYHQQRNTHSKSEGFGPTIRAFHANIFGMIAVTFTPFEMHTFIQSSLIAQTIHLIQPNWSSTHTMSASEHRLKSEIR